MNTRTGYFRLAAQTSALSPCLCAALACVAQPTRAAVTELWVQRSSNLISNSQDRVACVARDAAGNIIVTGQTDDGVLVSGLTIKYSGVDGAVLWQKRDNGPVGGGAILSALAVDVDGNVLVAGNCVNGTNMDVYTAKYASGDGALLWERHKNGPAGGYSAANALAVETNGDVVVSGSIAGLTNNTHYTAKYASANGALLWEQTSGYYCSGASALALDRGGNVVLAGGLFNGTNTDFFIAKYVTTNGALLWQQRYNGPAGGDDIANALAVDGVGNVVVAGSSYNGTNSAFYSAKYAAADGTRLWEQRFNSTDGRGWNDSAHAVAVETNGDVLVAGSIYGGSSSRNDIYTVKYASTDGALLWEQRHDGPGGADDGAAAIALDSSGNAVVTGYAVNTLGVSISYFFRDYYTAKYAAVDGSLLWEQTYDAVGAQDFAVAVAVDGNDDVVVTGQSQGASGTSWDYYTAKYSAVSGTVLWEQRYNGPGGNTDYAKAVVVHLNGDVVIAGRVTGAGGYFSSNGYYLPYYDLYTAKYAAGTGALLWEHRYHGPVTLSDEKVAVAVDNSGNVVVTGTLVDGFATLPYGGTGETIYTAKYAAADGALVWEQTCHGGVGDRDAVRGLALDASGNVIISGSVAYPNALKSTDLYTAKYAAADGSLLWENHYNDQWNEDDHGYAVGVDSHDDVVVTGSTYNGSTFPFYTAKYAGKTGTLLWEKRGTGNGQSRALALDSNGNVAVAGYVDAGGGNYNYYTAKYAGTNGALLWEKRYNGPANGDDGATAVAMDASGNVVVTGYSWNRTNYDAYTAKYASSNGALLWEKRDNDPNFFGSGFERVGGLAVDAGGNALVTMTDLGDYYTAAYAAANGALLWEKRYQGLRRGKNHARALALGPNGKVVVTGWGDAGPGGSAIATVLYQQPLPPVAIDPAPSGIRLRFTGLPGHSYNIERAPAVTGPWSTLATTSAPLGGLIDYTDMNPPSNSAFYRTSTQ